MKIRMNASLASLSAALALALPAGALAQVPGQMTLPKASPSSPTAPAAPKAVAQRSFASAEEAAKVLYEAVKAGDVKALVEIVGPKSRDWLFTGDTVSDKAEWARFAAAYEKKSGFEKQGDAKATLVVGEDAFPFAAPIVKRGEKWAFDAEAGREEVTNRRVGRNELDTLQTLLAIVDAQREYASADADGNKLNDYAARFMSSPGKKDGLYWEAKAGEPQSPLGPLAAKAVREGYGGKGRTGKPEPYHGYFFKILTKQGKDARGGAYDYVVNGKLFGGFAVLAYPAKHGVSGVMSFLVNHDGVVYEKNLGPSTGTEAPKIAAFNPDKSWTKAQVQ
jgi:hypothetical protein